MEKEEKLSPSTIKLLLKNPQAFILKFTPFFVRIDEFSKHLIAGRAFHKIAEEYSKTGEYLLENGMKNMEEDLLQYEGLYYDEDVMEMKDYILNGYNNYEDYKELGGTVETFATLENFVGYVDHISEDHVITDYKLVGSFMSNTRGGLFDPFLEYNIQLSLYAFRYFITTGIIPKVRIVEVLKKNAFIEDAQYIKKDALIAMCEGRDENDAKMTKEKIVEKYAPRLSGVNIYQMDRGDDDVVEAGREIYTLANGIRESIIANDKVAVAKGIKNFNVFVKNRWRMSGK